MCDASGGKRCMKAAEADEAVKSHLLNNKPSEGANGLYLCIRWPCKRLHRGIKAEDAIKSPRALQRENQDRTTPLFCGLERALDFSEHRI